MKLGSTLGSALLAALCGSIIVIACGGESDEEKAAAERKRQEEAELAAQDQFLGTYCEIILKCCNQILQKKIDDVPGCKAHLKQTDPVTIADKTARDACLAQTRAVAADPVFCKDFAHMDNPACPDPSRAKQKNPTAAATPDAGVKIGEVCNTVEDCAVDFSGVVDCAQGICQLRKRGAEGDTPCDTTVDGDVVLKLVEPSSEPTVFTCYRKGENGTQCDAKSKTCVVPVAERGKCDKDGTECEKSLFCDKPTGRCLKKLVEKSLCSRDEECKGHCQAKDGATPGEDDVAIGTCVDAVGEDEDCEATSWCADGLECISGKCTKPGPDARLAATCTP